MNKKTKSPLFHVAKRGALPWYKSWAIRGAALLLALVVCGVITSLVTGEDPIAVYGAIWKGSFGTSRRVWVLLQNIAMLLCVSLAVTPAFRMRCWNLGGEGQALIGCLASAACPAATSRRCWSAVKSPPPPPCCSPPTRCAALISTRPIRSTT